MQTLIRINKKLTNLIIKPLKRNGIAVELHGGKTFAVCENDCHVAVVENLNKIDDLVTRYYFAQGNQ